MKTPAVIIPIDRVMSADLPGARLPHDRKYAQGAAFVHGQYCPLAEAAIPLRDMGFLQCDAVYDKVTVARGRYFRLRDHFDRFARSCEKFALRCPHSDAAILEIFNSLLRLTGLQAAGVFWCVTRGLAKSVSDRNNPDAFENRFYAIVDGYGSIATEQQRLKGLDVLVSPTFIRIPPRAVDPTAKNFHWQDMKLSLFEARAHGKDWSVLTDAEGYVVEAPGANVFIVKQGALYTPDSGCLEGITRKTVLELAEMIGVPARSTRVQAQDLRTADEAFITSSAGGIMPINSVDGQLLGKAAGPGPLTLQLHNLYWEKLWAGWRCTPVDYGGARHE